MLRARLSNYYRSSKSALPVFVYVVSGTPEELEAYKHAKGVNHRENEKGEPLLFSARALSNNRNENINLSITLNGNVVADDLNKVLTQNEKLEDYILQEQAKLMASAAVSRAGMRGMTGLTMPTRTVATPRPEDQRMIDELAEAEMGDDIPA